MSVLLLRNTFLKKTCVRLLSVDSLTFDPYSLKYTSGTDWTDAHPAFELLGQLLVLEAAGVSQSVAEGFSLQFDPLLHHVLLQGPRGSQQRAVYLITNLKTQNIPRR